MSNISGIRGKIVERLQACDKIRQVLDYTPNSVENWPVAMVEIAEGEGDIGSNAHNIRRHTFVVRLFIARQETPDTGHEQAADSAVDVLDQVLTAFDGDMKLDGVAKFIRPIAYRSLAEVIIQDTVIIEIDIEATEIVNT
jgi:hypothetical protein